MAPTPAAAPTSAAVVPVDVRDEEVKPYVVAAEIGKGSFATVYRGYHQDTHAQVAIKTVSRAILTPKLLENLQSEIKMLKRLVHRHITELIEIVERPNSRNIYLIMEYCSGGDLSLYIKRRGRVDGLQYIPSPGAAPTFYPHPAKGGLDEVVCRSFLRQLARALKFLRQQDMIHRDIKPQNLLLTPATQRDHDKGQPIGVPILKVADFGFARVLPNAMMAETLCGSPLYMAPEILRYEKYDAKADLWSVGAVLYEMTVGKPPFRAQNHIELLKRIEHARSSVKFPDEDTSAAQADPITGVKIPPVPPDIKALIRSLLKRHPVERISYDEFFSSEALAKSKMRPSRSRSRRHDSSAAQSTAPSVASSSAASSPVVQTPSARLPPVSLPAVSEDHSEDPSRTLRQKSSRNPGAVQAPHLVDDPKQQRPSPRSRVSDIPEAHRVIPKEVLDPNVLIPPSPFDFRSRKPSGDAAVGTSGPGFDRPANPQQHLPRRSPQSDPAALNPNVPPAQPRSTKEQALAAATNTRRGAQAGNVEPDAPLATEVSISGGHDYILVEDTRVVEFNKAIDEINAGRVRVPIGSRQNASNTQLAAQQSKTIGDGEMRYPPPSRQELATVRRTSGLALPAGDRQLPNEWVQPHAPTFPPTPLDTQGNGAGRTGLQISPVTYPTPTRMASNALTKAINIASKRLFGTNTGGTSSGGSPGSAAGPGDGNSPTSHATGSGAPSYQPSPKQMPAPLTSAESSPRRAVDSHLPPEANDADDTMFANLEDIAQKTNVLTRWADELYARLKSMPQLNYLTERSAGKRRVGDSSVENSAAIAAAAYMLVMSFSQQALDQLREYQDQTSMASDKASGFDAALTWFKSTFLKCHDRATRVKAWLPAEHVDSKIWIEHLVFERALQLSRSGARKELLDQATSHDECEKLYEESLWCLYALRDDIVRNDQPSSKEDRENISLWITRTKLRLVRCRHRMTLDHHERLEDARADLNLDDVARYPPPWDLEAGTAPASQ